MISNRIIRLGTRNSALALYQAHAVKDKLKEIGIESEIIEITSEGDADLITPLYEMGIQGIFTKTLDIALLQNRVDIAVHSCKDVPTSQAKGLTLSAVLKRAIHYDSLVLPHGVDFDEIPRNGVIGTSSLRRKLQWLHRFPDYRTENLRGNIQKRLVKLDASEWQGAIFAQAALERLKLSSHKHLTLDWMLPSPAQGAIGVMCREDDTMAMDICQAINHKDTDICISAERSFLSSLEGGCTVPIGAFANIEGDEIHFIGNIMSLDATTELRVEKIYSKDKYESIGKDAAQILKHKGAVEIIESYREI